MCGLRDVIRPDDRPQPGGLGPRGGGATAPPLRLRGVVQALQRAAWCCPSCVRGEEGRGVKTGPWPFGRQKYMSCTVTGCDRKHHARGLCLAHVQRWRRRGEVNPELAIGDRRGFRERFGEERGVCCIEGCDGETRYQHQDGGTESVCAAHAKRFYRHGNYVEEVPVGAEPYALRRAMQARREATQEGTRGGAGSR